MNDLHFKALNVETLGDYLEFFDTRAFTDNPRWASCYCYFPLHDPKQTDWETRSGAENRVAISACVAEQRARGYLAYRGDRVVGWCNAGPGSQYPMLSEVLAPHADATGVVFCFVVAPEARGQGVAGALLAAACEGLREQGMASVLARPHRGAQGPAANHLGPLSMYLKAGFEIERETAEGEVFVRKALARR